MPKVSVLMTVYSGMPYLPAAIDSVLAQSFSDFELVVVNDGSTDATADYLASVGDPRLRVLHQENSGTAAAANLGMQHCSGEYVARMDADDISLPHRLATQVEFLEQNPEVGLVGAQIAPLGDAGTGRSLHMPVGHDEIFAAMMDGRHGLAHSCILYRAELLREIGGYWSEPLQDAWDMMIRMGEVSKLANIDQVLHHYRVHIGSLNGTGMLRMRRSIDFARECARRRQQGLPPISLDEYLALCEPKSWWSRLARDVDLHARCQYRLATAEIHSRRPVRGYARLAWAALLAPRLTLERIGRVITRVFRKHPAAGT